jgi:hypothetical protein
MEKMSLQPDAKLYFFFVILENASLRAFIQNPS